jgi:hypothetical protein
MNENIRELLGAYLCGDITPEERAAVEQLLAVDKDAQAEARELKALLGFLAREQPRTVTPAKVSALSAQVAARVRELSGGGPEAELSELQDFIRFLKQSERPVTEKLERELARRLSAALPGAGIGPLVAPKRASRRETAQLARLYLVQPSPWRTRLAWFGAAAAVLLLLLFGAAELYRLRHAPGGPGQETADTAAAPTGGDAAALGQGDAGAPSLQPAEHEQNTPGTQEAAGNNAGQANEKEAANAAEHEAAGPNPLRDNRAGSRAVVQHSGKEQPPALVAPKDGSTHAPKESTPNPILAHANAPQVNQNREPPASTEIAQRPPRPSGGDGDGVTAGGGVAEAGPNSGQPGPAISQPAKTPAAPTVPEFPANVAVVLITRGGNVQALTPDGNTLALAQNQVVPSGSQIITDQGRVAFRLPGGNEFWVNGASSLKLSYAGQAASAALDRGEIAYRSIPQGLGALDLVAGNVEVKDAKAVDVKIEDMAAKVAVLDKQATVGPKGQPGMKVKSGTKATIPLSGASPAKTEPIVGRPDSWTDDIAPMSDTKYDTRNGKSRSRRQYR